MKQTLFLISVFILTACIDHYKNHEDYEPEIDLTYSTSYESSLASGRVVFTMNFVKAGVLPVRHYGYSYSQNPNFEIVENQKLVSEHTSFNQPEQLRFTENIMTFENDEPYYVRAFFTSTHDKIFYSNVCKVSFLESEDGTPPCNFDGEGYHTSNTTLWLNPGNTFLNIINGSVNYFKSYSNSFGESLATSFSLPPATGVYRTTINHTSIKRGEVIISRGLQGSQHVLPNQLVYVQKINTEQFKVTVCNVDWKYPNSTGKITGSWILNY